MGARNRAVESSAQGPPAAEAEAYLPFRRRSSTIAIQRAEYEARRTVVNGQKAPRSHQVRSRLARAELRGSAL